MPRTMIGLDSAGYGCVKIMRNNADDPYTTPDSDVYKFLYNSKTAITMNLANMVRINTFPAGSTNYYPPGSTTANFTSAAVSDTGSGKRWCHKKEFFTSLRYRIPMFDVKQRKGSTIRYNQMMVHWEDSGAYYTGQGGYYYSGGGYQIAWLSGTNSSGFANIFGAWDSGIMTWITTTNPDGDNRFLSRDKTVVVWNLPGDSTAIDDAPILAPNGNKAIQIDSTGFRVAKPGYNVDSATVAQMALDSTQRLPVKVIAAGDIALPSGTSFIDLGFAIPDMIAMDVHFYTGSTIMYPTVPNLFDFGAEYWFDGNRIYFDASTAMRARYMVYLNDNSPSTGGPNQVWKTFNDGTRDVVQFLRAGAADPPAWADIIVDTRWPAVQILAQGTISVPSGNGVATDIAFNGTGMFPMVKYITTHGAGGGGGSGTVGLETLWTNWTNAYRPAFVKRLKYSYNPGSGAQTHAGESTYCELTANNARFWTFRGNVGNYYNRADSPGNWRTVGAYNPLEIRYYIFGIPQ